MKLNFELVQVPYHPILSRTKVCITHIKVYQPVSRYIKIKNEKNDQRTILIWSAYRTAPNLYGIDIVPDTKIADLGLNETNTVERKKEKTLREV